MCKLLNLLLVVLVLSLGVNSRRFNKMNNRIVGGTTVSIEDYPYQLSLIHRDDSTFQYSHICGASILSDSFALTAAHCTVGFEASSLMVRYASSKRNEGPFVSQVVEIHQHPDYDDRTFDSDLAVLRLANPIVLNPDNAWPIALTNQEVPDYSRPSVTGWGNTVDNEDANDLADYLQMVILPKLPQYECNVLLPFAITENQICAGGDANKGICFGDSGGPLVLDGKQVGIVTGGNGCGRENSPGIFVNVYNYVSWIEEYTGPRVLTVNINVGGRVGVDLGV